MEAIACSARVQEGIQEYFDTYLALCPAAERVINRKLDEAFLTSLHRIRVQDKGFIDLQVEDPFYNRMTKVEDLV